VTTNRREETVSARSHWRKVLLKIIVLASALILMFRWFEHSQVFQPYRSMRGTAAALERPWEDVFFEAQDGVKLNGWFFPAGTNATYASHVILFCHGNAGNISHRLESYETLLDAGINLFAFDYRGYGRSSGRPSESGTYQDAMAAYQWLKRKGFADRAILVWGESLGGAVAAELAVRAPTGGVVLQSTFTSIPAIGAEVFPWLPVKLICSIKYDTLSKIANIRAPLMILHSESDSIVAFHHGERLFAAARAPKSFCKLFGDHNDSWATDAEKYRTALRELIELSLASTTSR
jgi:uncharacterized protein